jgi:hypothetical protein
MTIRIIHYRFEGALKVEAESEAEALRKFEQVEDIDLARNALESLSVEWVETEAKDEGLSGLKASELVRI